MLSPGSVLGQSGEGGEVAREAVGLGLEYFDGDTDGDAGLLGVADAVVEGCVG